MKKLSNILNELHESIGYWIDKFGKVYNVDDASISHYRYAQQNFKDVQEELKKHYIPKDAPGQAIIDVTLRLGYIRVIKDVRSDKIDYYVQLERETLRNRAKSVLLDIMYNDHNKIKSITFDDRRVARTFFDVDEFKENLEMQSVLRESEEWMHKYHPKVQKLIQLTFTTARPSKEIEQYILKYDDPYFAYRYLTTLQQTDKHAYNQKSIEKVIEKSPRLWKWYSEHFIDNSSLDKISKLSEILKEICN